VHVVDLPGHGYAGASDESIDPGALCGRYRRAVAAGDLGPAGRLAGSVSLQAALEQPQIGSRHCGNCHIAEGSSPGRTGRMASPRKVFIEFRRRACCTITGRTIERFLALETLGSAHGHDELRALKAHVFDRGNPRLPGARAGPRVC
jgi:pimeloyl-[acyl-carrier protein] methyl ester esterase